MAVTLEESRVADRFANDVAQHEVRVLKDDDLYRHLMCRQQSGSFMHWFEIITTPGQLTIRGDMGTYVFARLQDMFDFFGPGPRINPEYWGEKLQASSDPIRRYSPQLAVQVGGEQLADALEWRALDEGAAEAVRQAFADEVLGEAEYEDSFRIALNGFQARGVRFEDTWEWDLREYDGRFLWNLHAIVWTIARYEAGEVIR